MKNDVSVDLLFGLSFRMPGGEEVKYNAKTATTVPAGQDVNAAFDENWAVVEKQVFDKVDAFIKSRGVQT